MKLDEEGHHLFNEGQEVELTQKEFDLLRLFLKNSGRVFTRQNLLDQVWGEDYFGDERSWTPTSRTFGKNWEISSLRL